MKAWRFILTGLFLVGSISAQAPSAPPLTKDQIEALKVKNATNTELNGLIAQTNATMLAKDWPKTVDLVKKLLVANAKQATAYPNDAGYPAAEPGYYQLLGTAYLNLGKYEDAIAGYEKCLGLAQVFRNGGRDFPGLKKTMGIALTSEGNAWLKLKKNKEAIACYERAAAFDPHPATAWFNICATEYNTGKMEDAVAAADKCIALDPTKADAYFIKGSCLFGNATVDAGGKAVVPAAAIVALQKYLELVPNGAHADDVKQMLVYAGAVVKTTDQPKTQ
ncbi:MAG: tetratricopeptide repeat protein [Opitutaceae bacterium]